MDPDEPYIDDRDDHGESPDETPEERPLYRRGVLLRMEGMQRAHERRTEALAARIADIYDTARDQYLRMLRKYPGAKAFGPFNAASSTAWKMEVDKQRRALAARIRPEIQEATAAEWEAAELKCDALVESVLKTSSLDRQNLQEYEARNLKALQAFQSRKEAGMNLSDRVWNQTGTFYKEMELAVETALGERTDAAQLSREVRHLLKEPAKLFRRVRDEAGNLNLSKAAALYHPGQGVYRSSAMNAMRLARTEVNMAYRTAEHDRWQRLDFVVGFRISLSNNHTVKDRKGGTKPLRDICDKLAGDYPKTFKFVGWHPHCRCKITPILRPYEEQRAATRGKLRAALRGREYRQLPSARQIRSVPPNFLAYISSISEAAKGWSTVPYYIRDNFSGGSIEGGLKPEVDPEADGKPPLPKPPK